MNQKTALYDRHIGMSGKMVPFAGYMLPVQYSEGVIAEHMATRNTAGLFDVSHMGQFVLAGSDATKNLCNILTADFTDMKDFDVKYSVLCNKNGGCVDDLVVYKRDDNHYLIVVNAANKEKDKKHILKNLDGDVEFTDVSDEISQIALQGPLAQTIISNLVSEQDIPVGYYKSKWYVVIAGFESLISRTGYTGEDGFEIYIRNQDAVDVWDAILKVGEPLGLIPCGLGARDTLRLEAAMPLYGHEMDENTSPLETGLGFAVKLYKKQFVGKEAIEKKGKPRSRIGIKITSRGIAREDCDVIFEDKVIGKTTSGTHLAYVGYAAAMALVETDSVKVGDCVKVNVRGRELDAVVVKLPFYKREK